MFTLNNYTPEDEVYLQETLVCQYIIYGREVAPTTGTPHLQGYVYFGNARAFEAVRKLRKWNIQVAKGDALQNGEYVKKDDDWFEKGTRPATPKEKGDRERDRYKRAYNSALAGDFTSIDSDILIRHYGTLKKFKAEFTKVEDLDYMPLCIYLYGSTGVGKSRLARELSQTYGAFRKEPMTKWFTGYQHEEIVWVDEIEFIGPELQSLYKRLCDHYVCPVESKGGNINIRPKVIIFTSNHAPNSVFGMAYEPMMRRLRSYNITHQNKDASRLQVISTFEEFAQARGLKRLTQGGSQGMDRQEEGDHPPPQEDGPHGDGSSSEGDGET